MVKSEEKIDVTCRIFSKWKHTSIILTGLFMLNDQGIINLTIEDKRGQYRYDLNDMGIEILVGDKISYIDVSDGYNDRDYVINHLNNCDYYFKRSFSTELNKEYGELASKMIPLGLNFTVYNKQSAKYQILPYSKKEYIIKKLVSSCTNLRMMNEYYLEDFEKKPEGLKDNHKVIFMARLWKSRDDSGLSCDDINQMRIELMRKLKERYGDNYIGGMEDNEISRKLCPELIAPKYMTNRINYINTMKRADVGIATTGLHNSIGGKFAEYVAASRAIVSERLNYEVPHLSKEHNYLEFSDVSTCLDQVERLMQAPELVYEMKKNNWQYYKEYLSPERQVLNIINTMLD